MFVTTRTFAIIREKARARVARGPLEKPEASNLFLFPTYREPRMPRDQQVTS